MLHEPRQARITGQAYVGRTPSARERKGNRKMNTDTTEILNKIINYAQKRIDITYIIQNGSRVNPSVIADKYADFDIIMGCQNPQKYIENHDWISEFGDLLILQLNEVQEDTICWPIFLMQFKDGLRIDLQYYPGNGNTIYHGDSLSTILLDKEHIFKNQFAPSEETYIVRKPEGMEYVKEVNNFWWCMINVGKGIARNELTYSRYMYESIVRENFLHIVSWYVSLTHEWNINCGKFGKFLPKYTDKEMWKRIEKTYYTDTQEEFWKSIFQACELVKMIDSNLRKELRITKEQEDVEGIIRFLKKIQIG